MPTTYTINDLEAVGTIEHADGPAAGLVTIYADPDGGCRWAAGEGEQPYQTDVEPGREATAWGWQPAAERADYLDTAALAVDADELRAVITYPLGEATRLIVTAHDEDGETIREAACPLSVDLAPAVDLRGDAQRDAERTAIAWVLGWQPDHEGFGDGSYVIRFW